jgi:hypothetical protein
MCEAAIRGIDRCPRAMLIEAVRFGIVPNQS